MLRNEKLMARVSLVLYACTTWGTNMIVMSIELRSPHASMIFILRVHGGVELFS